MVRTIAMCVLSACWSSSAFPIPYIRVTNEQLTELSDGSEALTTSLLLPELKRFFTAAENAIIVEPGDIIIPASFPDVELDHSCSHRIQALNGHAVGDVRNTSHLTGDTKVTWHDYSVFLDAELDASLEISGDVRVRTGVKLFGHCDQIARDTMALDLTTTGVNGVGISLSATRQGIERINGTAYLVFDFHADVVGKVVSWNVQDISVQHGCKIKILGITIASVCGYIEDKVRDKVQVLMDVATKVDAPKILQRLEDKINTAVGDTVRIPLKVAAVELV